MQPTFVRSEEMLERSLRVIPLGSQTFSKSHVQYPRGVSPHFIARGEGSQAWDLDGNCYIDFVNSLLSVSLGHCDPDVNAAVEAQLRDGVIFSLPHPLETEVAERIVAMAPCAEMVRFGKNGSDATSGAVRAARAFTKRDRVAVCGYHGWQDWYIGSTSRDLGVPTSVKDLTHVFTYNDLKSLEEVLAFYPDEFACVVLEPMNITQPVDGFLEGVAELTRAHGALVVFDETITGFRFSNGGAQELFGVVPDLATYGKGLANGFPLSAVTGRADIMRTFEDIFFSFTMGGEALSLAAAKAVLDKLDREPVTETLARSGRRLMDGVEHLIGKHDVSGLLSISGHPSWSFLTFRGAAGYSLWEIKTLWLQEVIARGMLCIGTHNISYAHSDADIDALLEVYDSVFPLLREAVDSRQVQQLLRCQAIEPLFKVR